MKFTKFIMSSEGSTCSRVENKLCSILLHQYYELELSFILCVLQYLRAIKEEHTLKINYYTNTKGRFKSSYEQLTEGRLLCNFRSLAESGNNASCAYMALLLDHSVSG